MKLFYARSRGIALVVTLLVIVILTIAVTAFMQSMTLERRTSQAYLNIIRSEEAVNMGLERIKSILAANTANDHFIVVKAEGAAPTKMPYYFIGTGNDQGGSTKTPAATTYVPLFSYLSSPTEIPPAPPSSTPGAGASNNMPVIPTLPASNLAAAKPLLPAWIPAVNTTWETVSTGDPIFPKVRYCYWTEDVSGYLDATSVGNVEGPGGTHLRGNGDNPKEIALYTIFDPAPDNDPSTNPATRPASKIVTNRQLILTSSSIQQLAALGNPAPLASLVSENLSAPMRFTKEVETIPFGFGYKDAGRAKYNLNTLVSTGGAGANVTAIAKVIDDNLPRFNTAERKGSLNASQNYTKNLAANVIDYVDVNNDGTVGADYRGIDSYPFVTGHYLRFRWRKVGNPAQDFFQSGGSWKARVDVDLWIQVWNLSDKDITSGTLRWDDSGNEYSLYAAGNNETPMQPEPGSTIRTIVFSTAAPLKKNEFKVVQFPVVSYVVDTAIASSQSRPTAAAGRPKISWKGVGPNVPHYSSNYGIYWNGVQVDRPGTETGLGGNRVERMNGSLDTQNATSSEENTGDGADWRGTYPGLRYGEEFDLATNMDKETLFNLGDPRSAYNIRRSIDATDYDANSAWYGRPYHYSAVALSQTTPSISRQTTPSGWADGGHDSARGYGIYELQPGSSSANGRYRNNRTPADIPTASRPAYDNRAPTVISNSGQYTSVLELGSIFDPLQWRPDFRTSNSMPTDTPPADRAAMLERWNSLDTQPIIADSGSFPLSEGYGMASTLRIGRGEFYSLDKEGLRAAQLLDLFTANPSSIQETKGRININTASRDVLRALYAGILLDRDPDLEPPSLRGSLYPPRSTPAAPAADIFADTIIANRPFLSPAKVSSVRTTLDDSKSIATPQAKIPLFGNAGLWPAAQRPTAWIDPSREEFFKKTFQLSTVRSRNFKVYVTGEVLNARGRVASRQTREFHLNLVPPRTADGTIVPGKAITVETIYEAQK